MNSSIPAPTIEDLQDLDSRILSLKESIDSFVLSPELKWPEIADKLSTLHVRLLSLHQNLQQSTKWKTSIIEPYALLNHAELVPQVFLRSRFLPEIEEHLLEYEKCPLETTKSIKYQELVTKCADVVNDHVAQNRYTQRYQLGANEHDYVKLGKNEEKLLSVLSRYVRVGSV